jgi:hypothetical protein
MSPLRCPAAERRDDQSDGRRRHLPGGLRGWNADRRDRSTKAPMPWLISERPVSRIGRLARRRSQEPSARLSGLSDASAEQHCCNDHQGRDHRRNPVHNAEDGDNN